MKDQIKNFISILLFLVLLYNWLENLYVKRYKGNSEIVFIDYAGIDDCNYLELFFLPELKDKYAYVTLNLRGDWEMYREDLLSMDSLTKRYKGSNIVFLYTVDNIERWGNTYDWKKTIRKYNLRGYHINLPDGCERRFKLADTTDSRLPKYLLVSNTGEIVTKWAPSPFKTKELSYLIDSLLMK